MKKSSDDRKVLEFKKILKGVVIAYLFSIIFFLVLALVLYFTSISENIIPIAVVIISAASILLGGVRITKDIEGMGWLHGGVTGFLYMGILIIISLIISPSVTFTWNIALDLFLGFLVGVLAGILGVSL